MTLNNSGSPTYLLLKKSFVFEIYEKQHYIYLILGGRAFCSASYSVYLYTFLRSVDCLSSDL